MKSLFLVELFAIYFQKSSFFEFWFCLTDHSRRSTEVPLGIRARFDRVDIDPSLFASSDFLTSHMDMEIEICESAQLVDIEEFFFCRDREVETFFQNFSPKCYEHIVNRSKSCASRDKYFRSCFISQNKVTKYTTSSEHISYLSFSENSSSSSLFCEFDEECDELAIMFCDRIWSWKCTSLIVPEKCHKLSRNTRSDILCFYCQLECCWIEYFFLGDFHTLCFFSCCFIVWSKVCLCHSTLWTSPALWYIHELCTRCYATILVSYSWIIDHSTWETDPLLSFWKWFFFRFSECKTSPLEYFPDEVCNQNNNRTNFKMTRIFECHDVNNYEHDDDVDESMEHLPGATHLSHRPRARCESEWYREPHRDHPEEYIYAITWEDICRCEVGLVWDEKWKSMRKRQNSHEYSHFFPEREEFREKFDTKDTSKYRYPEDDPEDGDSFFSGFSRPTSEWGKSKVIHWSDKSKHEKKVSYVFSIFFYKFFEREKERIDFFEHRNIDEVVLW